MIFVHAIVPTVESTRYVVGRPDPGASRCAHRWRGCTRRTGIDERETALWGRATLRTRAGGHFDRQRQRRCVGRNHSTAFRQAVLRVGAVVHRGAIEDGLAAAVGAARCGFGKARAQQRQPPRKGSCALHWASVESAKAGSGHIHTTRARHAGIRGARRSGRPGEEQIRRPCHAGGYTDSTARAAAALARWAKRVAARDDRGASDACRSADDRLCARRTLGRSGCPPMSWLVGGGGRRRERGRGRDFGGGGGRYSAADAYQLWPCDDHRGRPIVFCDATRRRAR